MKKHLLFLTLFFISLLPSSCIKKTENGEAKTELRGKVKSVEELKYNLFVNDNGTDTQLLYVHYISKYNSKGVKTEMTWFSTQNKKDITQRDYFKYDDKGNVIKLSRYNYRDNRTDSTLWEYSHKYDNKGNLIEKNSNKPEYNNVIKKETYKYNWRGRKTEANWYGFDSTNLQITLKFDKKGNNIEQFSDGTKSTSKYDKCGNLIEWNWFNHDGSVKLKRTYKYDKYNNVTEMIEYNIDRSYWEKTTYTYKYKYDKMGNWIEMSSEHEDELGPTCQIFVRKIEYY